MDPASAFAVACGAVQLTGVCLKAAKACRQILKNKRGTTNENEVLAVYVEQISPVAATVDNSLKSAGSKISEDQQRLHKIVKECLNLAEEMRIMIEYLSSSETQLRIFLRHYKKKDAVRDLQAKLARCHKVFDTELLMNMRYATLAELHYTVIKCVQTHNLQPLA